MAPAGGLCQQLSANPLGGEERTITVNWDAVGALAELVGAVGVILSLVYLARQIGQNTRSVRVASYQSWFNSYDSLSNIILASSEFDALLHRGLGDPDSLSEEDSRRVRGVLRRSFRQFENLYYQHSEAMIDPSLYEAWHRVYSHIGETPGFRFFWENEQGLFSEAFRRVIDEMLTAQPADEADVE